MCISVEDIHRQKKVQAEQDNITFWSKYIAYSVSKKFHSVWQITITCTMILSTFLVSGNYMLQECSYITY
jgi:hypothetical protein